MKNQKKAMLFALGAVMCWSTVATAFKLSLQYFSPSQLLLIATCTASTVLAIILLYQGRLSLCWDVFKRHRTFFLLTSFFNPTLYYLVLFQAYDLLPAQQAQTINYTWAITLSIMAAVFLGQRMSRWDWIAVLLGYFGAFIIATKGQILALNFESNLGIFLAVLSTLIWAGFWIVNTKNTVEPILALMISFTLALPMIVLANALFSDFNMTELYGWIGAIYIGVFELAIPFIFWLTAMRYAVNTARMSNLIFISPFISLIFLYFLVGEQIYPATLVGLLFIVFALILQQIKAKPTS